MNLTTNIQDNTKMMKSALNADKSFDIVYRAIEMNGKGATLFFVDGLVKDEVFEKIIEFFYSLDKDEYFENVEVFVKNCVPYIEVDTSDDTEKICAMVLSGVTAVLIDGFDSAVLIDLRTYPQRENGEPEKDKVLRGSKDSFVETVVFNTALIRRRIRDPKLIMKYFSVGSISKADVVLCYLEDKADMALVDKLNRQIENIRASTLSMTQESLVEALYKQPWYNPFPKVKYTERPDAAAANVADGNVIVLVDNSPSAMIMPTSIFDILEEPDDYYFPPITGTYLRISRYLVTLITLFITPLWLLALKYPDFIPDTLSFILVDQSKTGIPIVAQLLLLELIIDGLRLASLNTPNTLTTSLSVIAAISLSQFAVDVGWFTAETLLYMAFVAVANYTQPNYELGYCLKFARVLLVILTAAFGIWGFSAGFVLIIVALCTNKTISGKSYMYPLIPFNGKKLKKAFFRAKQ